MHNRHLDKILGHLEDLDAFNRSNLMQRLIRERSLLETVFNTVREGLIVIDAEGVIEYSNEAANRMIGLRESDEKPILWRWVPGLRQTLPFNAQGKLGSLVLSREFEITYPENRYVRLYMAPFGEAESSPEDGVEKFIVILTDITEERASFEKRVESERLSSIFLLAAEVAHEIGNPLNSIGIHLQLLNKQIGQKKRFAEKEKMQHSIEICRKEVVRLDSIIRNFLEAIRPQCPHLKEVQIMPLLSDVLLLQRNEFENANVRVELDIPQHLPDLRADPDQVKQAFFNVFKNAREAMESGGKLRITARTDDEYLNLHFVDQGVGIHQEDMGKVFKPFATTKSEGHGLGMMIVQRILRDHGGRIAFDSRPNTGTIVTLQFPLQTKRIRMLQSDQQEK